jgi:Putative adhesin
VVEGIAIQYERRRFAVTDAPTSKQPDIPEEHSNENRENIQEGSDIVKRTSLSLPSLSGFEQIPFLPSDWREGNATSSRPVVSIWEEVPLPDSSPPKLERRSSLPGVPNLPGPATKPGDTYLQSLSLTNEQEEQAAQLRSSSIPKQASGQGAKSLKKVRLRPLEIVTLLTILIFGTFVYIYYTHSMTPTKPSTPVSNPIFPVRQGSNVTMSVPQSNNTTTAITQGSKRFQVGTDVFIIIKGNSENVSVHVGSPGIVIVETHNGGSEQESKSTQYNQSRDGQGHDYINIATTRAGGNANYDITAPDTAQVQVEGDSGSMSINGISGVTITTNSGNIAIDDVNGPTNVSTQSGDVVINNVKGQTVVRTVNGSIKVNGITGQLKAVTQNGDITVQQAALSGQSVLQTKFGSVNFTGDIDPNGTYTMETQSGNVDLTLPANAAFQLQTSINSGSVQNEFGSNSVGSAPQAQIVISIGSGSVIIKKAA